MKIARLSDLAEYGYVLTVTCWTCRRHEDQDVAALLVAQGDKPLARLRFRCTRCGGRCEWTMRPG